MVCGFDQETCLPIGALVETAPRFPDRFIRVFVFRMSRLLEAIKN